MLNALRRELLARLRGLCPQCVCILMSGRADTRVLADAINRVDVYHYIAKPRDAPALRAIMAKAMNHRELLRAAG